MEITNIRNIDELKASKRLLEMQVENKERELGNKLQRLQFGIKRVLRPINFIRSAISWLLAIGPLKNGRSLGYKIGYAIASNLFRNRRR